MFKYLYLIMMGTSMAFNGINNGMVNLTTINNSWGNNTTGMMGSFNNFTNGSMVNNTMDNGLWPGILPPIVPAYCKIFKNNDYEYCAQNLNLLQFCQNNNISMKQCFHHDHKVNNLKFNKLLGGVYYIKDCTYYRNCNYSYDYYYEVWSVLAWFLGIFGLIILLSCFVALLDGTGYYRYR